MLPSSSTDPAIPVPVGMGQAVLGFAPTRFSAVIGSCVVVSMYSSGKQFGVIGHIVLPHTSHNTAMPTKYADIAVPYMIRLLAEHSVDQSSIVAKLAGGASMFGETGMPQIGEENISAVINSLNTAGIPIAGKHVGGTSGRRVLFDCNTGAMQIEMVGSPVITLG